MFSWRISLIFNFLSCFTSSLLVDPLLEHTEDAIGELRSPRQVLRFTQKQKDVILGMHNRYRSLAVPSAANMRLMRWDYSKAELSAQQWADNCVFEHGMPPGFEEMGQNLYIGGNRDGTQATFLWWNETIDYDFWKNSCILGAMCGHYTQIMWASSHLLGCAISSCPQGNLIVCHYYPGGNVRGFQPYKVGARCSQCNAENGGFCYRGLCVTKEQCKSLGSNCSCPLVCHNCASLNSKMCECNCKKGWDSLDCSKSCHDSDSRCGQNPGFPTPQVCNKDLQIKNNLCRSMCGQCNMTLFEQPKLFFDPDITGEHGHIEDVCCGGLTCEDGYVLDTSFCECSLLCPGPKCGCSQVERSLYMMLISILFTVIIYICV